MPCASVTIRLRGLMYVNLANQSVTYVSGTFVTLDSGLNTPLTKGRKLAERHFGKSSVNQHPRKTRKNQN